MIQIIIIIIITSALSLCVVKLEAGYNKEAEEQAQVWIEAITEDSVGGTDVFEGLRDGSHLCR